MHINLYFLIVQNFFLESYFAFLRAECTEHTTGITSHSGVYMNIFDLYYWKAADNIWVKVGSTESTPQKTCSSSGISG